MFKVALKLAGCVVKDLFDKENECFGFCSYFSEVLATKQAFTILQTAF